MAFRIYTKTGDDGTTGLYGGARVPKYDLRIEAYGTVDELNSYIGLIRDQSVHENTLSVLLEIQDRLFTIGALLAAQPGKKNLSVPELKPEDVEMLEKEIDRMDTVLEPMKHFILPGGHPTVSFVHIARCVCRRAERLVVHLAVDNPVDDLIIKYLNRLSDYLFTLARMLSKELRAAEQPWIPRM
jgi:cob(I)alamin adenosyltransferase